MDNDPAVLPLAVFSNVGARQDHCTRVGIKIYCMSENMLKLLTILSQLADKWSGIMSESWSREKCRWSWCVPVRLAVNRDDLIYFEGTE